MLRWPGLIWAVPLAALIIVVYLAVQGLAQRGELVTVTFDRAAGARAGETKVLYQGVDAGKLVKIVPNKDGRRLDFKLRLVPEAKGALNTNTRFWLIGATPDLSDFNSLKAVVSGVAVGIAPGVGGRPTRRFEGLDEAPTVLPGDHGTRYFLNARQLGSVRVGSGIRFHGLAIGKVTNVQFKGLGGFRLEIFVFQPYVSLIKSDDRFWQSSPLRLSFSSGSLDANLGPPATLLAGGIDVDLSNAAAPQTQSPPATEFTLYATEGAARQGLSGPALRYDFDFPGDTSGLIAGAPVTLRGFQVGEVEAARLAYDARSHEPYTVVTALLYPRQLDPQGAAQPSLAQWRSATDDKLRQLLRLGFRATLRESPPLVGSQEIALLRTASAGVHADLVYAGPNPRIPSAASPGLESMASQAGRILAKLDRVPIAEIGRNLQSATQNLQNVTGSLDATLNGVRPQLAPLVANLNRASRELAGTAAAAHELLSGVGAAQDDSLPEAVRQLSDAARSVRSLSDYLDRHPEALLRGKRSAP